MKIVWICHFSNQKIRDRLALSERKISNSIRSIIGGKKILYGDFAPWVTNLIYEFEKFKDVELHVISPHAGLKKWTCEFEMNGVYYHFFRPEWPLMMDKLAIRMFGLKKRQFRLNRFVVKKYIRKIEPDIVNLIGTENPYYSITALDISTIPVFVSAQTVYTNPERLKLTGNCDPFRWDLEMKIHQKEAYFGCIGRMHRDMILKNNPNAIIFKNFFPIEKPEAVKEVPKEYDFVFFAAGVTPKKGIEDALDALALVNKEKPGVSLNVVGRCAPDYKSRLVQKIAMSGLVQNVYFNDYFPVHADMHQHIKKARFALLPIKLDVISGTVIEAMLLELPLVTYKTTGTPYLNKDGQTVLLGDIGDIEKLAANMMALLDAPELAEKLKREAKAFVEREFDNTRSARRLVKNYRAVIAHYRDGQPIPEDRLFDLKEFPLY